ARNTAGGGGSAARKAAAPEISLALNARNAKKPGSASSAKPGSRPNPPTSVRSFGRRQQPVGIARGEGPREGPHLDMIDDLVRRTVDDGAGSVGGHGVHLRREFDRDLRHPVGRAGLDDLSAVDGD